MIKDGKRIEKMLGKKISILLMYLSSIYFIYFSTTLTNFFEWFLFIIIFLPMVYIIRWKVVEIIWKEKKDKNGKHKNSNNIIK